MMSRRHLLGSLIGAASATALARRGGAQSHQGHEAHAAPAAGPEAAPDGPYRPVVTPNARTLPWHMRGGVKEFQLVAEPVEREFAPGMRVRCWGYNGSTPGPTLEAVEGDRVRILVTNRLPEHTTVHWHGILLPNGMDGVGGLNQPHIRPGETYAYEFTLRQHGTFMYHPHADEMLQMAVGMMGMFVIHPRRRAAVDRDYALLLHEWAVHPGTWRPDPSVMLDFNLFSMNSRVFPGIDALVAKTGDRVRIRLGNLSMNQHPIHLHGYAFRVTGTDGGPVPESAQLPLATVPVPVGSTRDIEFVADVPGDWAFHCHKSHHTMNAMGHQLPNTLGVDQGGLEDRMRKLVPGYRAMGESGMAEMAEMTAGSDHSGHGGHGAHGAAGHGAGLAGPENTLPMMLGQGPFGPIEMGGMFTVLKVRDALPARGDPGWYRHPAGTLARRVPS